MYVYHMPTFLPQVWEEISELLELGFQLVVMYMLGTWSSAKAFFLYNLHDNELLTRFGYFDTLEK